MTAINKNILSNILGKGISALLAVLFVPFYLKFMGPEAYGLVGLFGTLQAIFMLADLGLSSTFTRETARLSVLDSNAREMRDLSRTFEGIFSTVGILGALSVALLSGLIAQRWLHLDQLSVATATNTIILIGIAIGLQFPFIIYQGGLQGLQRQMVLNVLLVVLAFIRGAGAILILKFVQPSIQAFFAWQVVISAIQLALGHTLLWRAMPARSDRPRFNLKLIRPLWRFAATMAVITFLGVLLTQADKLILTKMLPLKDFGYYTLAGVIANVMGMIAFPFSTAVYPRFVQLVATQNITELTEFYHRSCQALAVFLLPVGLLLAFFSKEILLVWTGNAVTAQNTFLFATLLVIGATLMGLMIIPFTLQLAFAWTKLGLYANIIAIVILIPSLVWLVSRYGAIGACFLSIVLYGGQFIVMIHFMHRRILQSEKWKWYVNDVAKPLVLPLLIMTAGRLLVGASMTKTVVIGSLGVLLFVSICSSAMSVKYIRDMFLLKIDGMMQRTY